MKTKFQNSGRFYIVLTLSSPFALLGSRTWYQILENVIGNKCRIRRWFALG